MFIQCRKQKQIIKVIYKFTFIQNKLNYTKNLDFFNLVIK